jgi:hypothetical protein
MLGLSIILGPILDIVGVHNIAAIFVIIVVVAIVMRLLGRR